MKATLNQQLILLDVQALDTMTARLRRQKSQLPQLAAIAGLAGETAEIRDRYMTAQRELEAASVELGRLESDVVTVRERSKRDQDRLATNVTGKQAEALQAEIDNLARRAGELEELQLGVMERTEEIQGRFDGAQGEMNALNERRSALETELGAEETRLDAELADNLEARKNLAVTVAGDLLALYEETRAQVGLGAARLRGRVSEGSNMALTPAEIAQIREVPEDEIVFCPGSGAILVRVPETPTAE